MLKNIFFDFDGVIADSVNVKTEAFYKIYKKYGKEIAINVAKHHKANGGMSRYEKFKLYHKKFLGKELSDNQVNELASKFSKLVKQGVIDSPEVPGSHSFLYKSIDKYNMFVITGTPTNESVEICKSRNIFHCFKGIYGSPEKKDYWCNFIINKYKLNTEETIFVGDALADYSAAVKNNLTFYLREYDENEELFSNKTNIIRFNNFIEFEELLNKQ